MTRTPRILITGKPMWFEKDAHSAISFYRMITPLGELHRQGHIHLSESPQGLMPDVVKNDIVFLHTPTHTPAVEAIFTAKKHGRKVWLDFDDMIFADDIPKANLAWTFFNGDEQKRNLKAGIKNADAISVSTQRIKERIVDLYGFPEEKIWIIPNALPDALWAQRNSFLPHNKGITRMMWRGSVTHEGDLMKFRNGIKPHDGMGFLFVGHLPWVLHKQYGGHLEEIQYQPWAKPMERYWQLLIDAAPHYLFVCLERCSFNEGKSNIAWLEATFAGAACIAQEDMPEFAKVPTIQYSTPKQLDGIFRNIAGGTDLRTEKYMQSRAVIESEYLLSITNKKRLEVIKYLMR